MPRQSPVAFSAVGTIERKRDGHELTEREITAFIDGFTSGEIPEYQTAAFAMAVYFKGMTPEETAALTRAMTASGTRFEHPTNSPTKVDKHSTGGIGDKTSPILAPLLACHNVWVPMVSGRGLGITGGTLDKLESIPGLTTGVSLTEAYAQLAECGVVMMGQTPEICPADRALYALRDVTATVPSRPLIVASILSKKLAESLDRLVLDVKFGSGAFMKTRDEAEQLAEALATTAAAAGLPTETVLSPMEEPLGHAVGNALEIEEVIQSLQGKGPTDLVELTLDLAAALGIDRAAAQTSLTDGTALARFEKMVGMQGGDLEAFGKRPPAPVIREISAPKSGTLTALDAETIGRAAVTLGAGRQKSDDVIDMAVGFDQIAKVGESPKHLARVHAASEEAAEIASQSILAAATIE